MLDTPSPPAQNIQPLFTRSPATRPVQATTSSSLGPSPGLSQPVPHVHQAWCWALAIPPHPRTRHGAHMGGRLWSLGLLRQWLYCLLLTVRIPTNSLLVILQQDIREADHLATEGKVRAGPVIWHVEEAGGSRPKGKQQGPGCVHGTSPRMSTSSKHWESLPLHPTQRPGGLWGWTPRMTSPHPEQTARGDSETPTAACSGCSAPGIHYLTVKKDRGALSVTLRPGFGQKIKIFKNPLNLRKGP